eukprot:1954808-Pyramimonas_sp.AAC.1
MAVGRRHPPPRGVGDIQKGVLRRVPVDPLPRHVVLHVPPQQQLRARGEDWDVHAVILKEAHHRQLEGAK